MTNICNDCMTNGLDQCLFEKYWSGVKWCILEGIDPREFTFDDENYEDIGIDVLQSSCSDMGNALLRKEAYRAFVQIWQGFLGAHNRVQMPYCVTVGVRKNSLENMVCTWDFTKSNLHQIL